jgi:hypothetical protein
MSEQTRMWIEIIFNVFYLVAVWSLVALMLRHRGEVPDGEKKPAFWILLAFFFSAWAISPTSGSEPLCLRWEIPQCR